MQTLEYPEVPIVIEIPPEPKLGDRSCTIALALAKPLKRKPRDIAETIAAALPQLENGYRVEIASPGFLNFFFSDEIYHALLKEALDIGAEYGSSQLGLGEKRLFEYVSANPTGPMNIVSARAAAIGDSLVKLQRKAGFDAYSEFYVNDTGKQVKLLGESVRARAAEVQGGIAEIPEGGYHGDYIIDLATAALAEMGDQVKVISDEELGRWSADKIMATQRTILQEYGVEFDRWYRESELYDAKMPQKTLEKLRSAGHIYEEDGATYFRSSDFGDDEDRVVVTSDGRPTYYLPDIAYHLDKAERGFKKAIDLLGPDHHGHGKRMQAAMRALALGDDFLEIIIVQQVNLMRAGIPVRMSKRAGEIVSMKELLDEVGADAAKQIFLSRRWSSHLDFDIEAAKDRSERSPVFYLQYAHARICSIFCKADGRAYNTDHLNRINTEEERNLLRSLSIFPDVVASAAMQYAPNRVNSYLNELATVFSQFYHHCRVITEDDGLTSARLAMCRAVQIVLKEGLRLLGMSAPEKM
ncbi:arginine--tRNA ligase [bacterium]|nr:arginine--tRNA ligase [bacterium]